MGRTRDREPSEFCFGDLQRWPPSCGACTADKICHITIYNVVHTRYSTFYRDFPRPAVLGIWRRRRRRREHVLSVNKFWNVSFGRRVFVRPCLKVPNGNVTTDISEINHIHSIYSSVIFSLPSISSHLLRLLGNWPKPTRKNPYYLTTFYTLNGPISRAFSPFKSSFSVCYLRSHCLLYMPSYLFVVTRLFSTRSNVVSSLVFPAKPLNSLRIHS